jgi:outer membrane protein, multidrug efflux system
MKKNKPHYILILFAIYLLAGCKSSKSVQTEPLLPIPESFVETKDSINSSTINWKQYFTDPNLISLIETGLKNNLDLSMALQRIEAARSSMRLNQGALFPTVGANISFLQRKFGYYTMDDAGNRTTEIEPGVIIPTHLPDYFVGLQASWEVDVWGKLRNKKKAAFSRYLSSIEGKNFVITNLIAEIAISYYDLLALDNQLDIIRESIKLQEDALSIIKIQKQSGAANELAVKQFEAQVLNSKALEMEVLQELLGAESEINFLLGRFPQPVNRDKLEFTKIIPFQPRIGIPADMLKNRPDIRQAEFEVIASKADVKAAKAAFFPSLNITGGIGFQAFKPGFLFTAPQSIAYNLLGSLITPLINRSVIKSQFGAANAYQQEALYNYQKTILNGYVEVYNEVNRIKNLEQLLSLRSQQVDVLTQSIQTSSDLFKTGRANYFEVLITQNNVLESRLELIDVKRRQYAASIKIYKALGGGWR